MWDLDAKANLVIVMRHVTISLFNIVFVEYLCV